TVRKLFTAAAGDTVVWASRWRDRRDKRSLVVISTDKSVHVLTETGAPVMSAPRAFDRQQYQLTSATRLEDPERYVFWYAPIWCRGPEELGTMPSHVLEYDAAGRELSRRTLPPLQNPAPAYAEVWLGLATPLTEAALLVGTTRYLRSEARSAGGT